MRANASARELHGASHPAVISQSAIVDSNASRPESESKKLKETKAEKDKKERDRRRMQALLYYELTVPSSTSPVKEANSMMEGSPDGCC